VFERSLQYQPVRGVDFQEECYWSHARKSFKRAGVGTNGIMECKFLSKNAHRTEHLDLLPASAVVWPPA
jgi:hypothetical protein